MEEIRRMLEEKLGVKVEISTSVKNGVKKDCYMIGEGPVRPTLYAVRSVKKAMADSPCNDISEKLIDWEYIKDRLVVCLRRHIDGAYEDDIVRSFLDLDKYVRIRIDVNDRTASSTVHKGMLEKWGKTEDEVFDQAVKNMKYKHFSLGEMFGNEDNAMQVITTANGAYGASAMLSNDTLDEIALIIGTDKMYILPSSIHEIIAVKYDDENIDVDGLRNMVSMVNASCVEDCDMLSNNVYIYDGSECKVA